MAVELTAQLPKTTFTRPVDPEESLYYEFRHAYGISLIPGYYITKHIRMRMEYLYANYSTHKFQRILDITAPPPETLYLHVDIKGKVHPETHTFLLGLDYQF